MFTIKRSKIDFVHLLHNNYICMYNINSEFHLKLKIYLLIHSIHLRCCISTGMLLRNEINNFLEYEFYNIESNKFNRLFVTRVKSSYVSTFQLADPYPRSSDHIELMLVRHWDQ